MTGQSFVILVGGRREAPIECGAGLRKFQSKGKILHPLFAFLQLAVHTAGTISQPRFQFGVGRSPDWPVKCDIEVMPVGPCPNSGLGLSAFIGVYRRPYILWFS